VCRVGPLPKPRTTPSSSSNQSINQFIDPQDRLTMAQQEEIRQQIAASQVKACRPVRLCEQDVCVRPLFSPFPPSARAHDPPHTRSIS
jgi:hypothetical protein